MPKPERLRVVIVSEVRLYRDGLTDVLNRDSRLEVVGTAASAESALKEVERHQPDSVLLDIAVPRALPTINKISQEASETKVIALGLRESEEDVVVACAEAGIAGYVCREGTVAEVVRAVETAVRDEFGCSRRVAAALVRRVRKLRTKRTPLASLTPRERQIAQLLREGLSNKQIATQLFIEVATVKTHVHNILEKLNAQSRVEAATKIMASEGPRYRFGRRVGSTV